MLVRGILHWGGMDYQVVGGIVEDPVGFHQERLQGLGQIFEHLRGRILEGRFVAFGKDPGFEGEARGVGG